MGAVTIQEGAGKLTGSTVIRRRLFSERVLQFVKFCLVGGSGTMVDMGVLFLLADPRMLGWNVTISKLCAAEIALLSNFTWNELWTFKSLVANRSHLHGILRRL